MCTRSPAPPFTFGPLCLSDRALGGAQFASAVQTLNDIPVALAKQVNKEDAPPDAVFCDAIPIQVAIPMEAQPGAAPPAAAEPAAEPEAEPEAEEGEPPKP